MAGIKYAPLPAPADVQELPRYLEQELQRLATAINDHQMRLMGLDVLTVAPNNPQDGDMAYADGSTWNPGAGRGVYEYNAGWVKL